MKTTVAFSLMFSILLGGCGSLGSKTVQYDRLNYVMAISESLKTQMLLNLVKLRYGDVPVFLDVSSVINQYSVEGDISFDNSVENNPYLYTSGAGISGHYADRPTISYTPLTGDKFTRSLMTPIPPAVVLNFIQAGKSSEFLFRLCVQSINGIQNQGIRTAADPRYERIITLISELQGYGGVVVKFGEGKDKGVTYLIITQPEDPNTRDARQELRTILKLKPDAGEYTVVYGGSPANDTEVAMVTRSVFDIMTQVALSADVPQNDIDQGRAMPRPPLLREWLTRIHSGTSRPTDAAVMVRYRNLWFWIDDKDLRSKSVFSVLLLMVNLAESGQTGAGPLITVPVG